MDRTIGDRLLYLRKRKGVSQKEVADAVGLASGGAVGNYERGDREPDSATLRRLADYYGVSLAYLYGEQFHPVSPEVVFLPVVSQVRAGKPMFAQEDVEEMWPVEKDHVRGGEFFWMRVDGDSMSGRGIMPGGYVLVRRQHIVENGEIAVLEIEGEGICVKRVNFLNGFALLISENPKYEPVTIPIHRVRVIGKVTLSQQRH